MCHVFTLRWTVRHLESQHIHGSNLYFRKQVSIQHRTTKLSHCSGGWSFIHSSMEHAPTLLPFNRKFAVVHFRVVSPDEWRSWKTTALSWILNWSLPAMFQQEIMRHTFFSYFRQIVASKAAPPVEVDNSVSKLLSFTILYLTFWW